mgnify:CR=1 FL=1
MKCILLDKEHWKYVQRDGYKLLKIQCPKCDEWGDLIDHSINDEGFIEPSVICPECEFHSMIALKDFMRDGDNEYK